MRRAPVPAVLVCGTLLLVTSCAWGGAEESGESPPGAPAGVTADAGSATSVHVMWNEVSAEPPITEYEIYQGSTKVKEVDADEHMVDVVQLKPSTTYTFTVRARDAEGRLSDPSIQVEATTPAAGPADDSPPTRPGTTSGQVTGSQAVQLQWGASKDNQKVVSYDIFQGDTKIHSVGGTQTAAVVTGLRPSTDYSFTVKARDAADNVSPAGNAVRLTTAAGDDSGQGTAPTDFTATTRLVDGAYNISLTWMPPAVDGVISEYQIQLDGQSATSLVWGAKPPEGLSTYSFYIGEKAGETHKVRLRAKLPDGTWGGYSAERTVTTGEDDGES
ncbi:fibronectin type III domain-containing protein [Streptomyces sp. NPDC059477]|uniref:fibronectin type III domain-containing protein n=1 Tax=Streptomyces sp. NPDC059477 TaxID=3346847 RepID=UPI0036C9EE08